MAKHIGIVACSAEGAALCYRTLCAEAPAAMGEHRHPEVSMHTHCLADYMTLIYRGDWRAVAGLMLSSARKLASIGAEFAICPDNTIHQAFDEVAAESPIPWLHIARVVGEEAQARGYKRLGITGTRFLAGGPVYPTVLQELGLECRIPCEADCERINTIIFKELVNGIVREASRLIFDGVVRKLAAEGCDAVVLGCTELPLLVPAGATPLPTLDSTRLLARAALKTALAPVPVPGRR